MKISDQPVLLVTGGSRGIGAAICFAAAEQGWAVAVNYASNRRGRRCGRQGDRGGRRQGGCD